MGVNWSNAGKGIISGGAWNQDDAADDQTRLSDAFGKKLDVLQGDFEDLSADYLAQFTELSEGFDPLDLQNEFDSLYEAIIMPMERQFSESILPQIRQSYSGGGYGSSMFSGARESTEAQARQQLSMNEAMLKMQGREAGIARNFQDYDRRRSDLGLQLTTAGAPIQSAIGVEGMKYGAQTDAIAARSAAGQAWGNLGPRIAGSIGTFFGGGSPTQQPGVGQSQGSNVQGQGVTFNTPYTNTYGYNSNTGAYAPQQQQFQYNPGAQQTKNVFNL